MSRTEKRLLFCDVLKRCVLLGTRVFVLRSACTHTYAHTRRTRTETHMHTHIRTHTHGSTPHTRSHALTHSHEGAQSDTHQMMFTHTHTRTYAHTHTHVHTHIHTHKQPTYMLPQKFTTACTRTHTHTRTNARTHTRTHGHTHTRTHAHTHTRTHGHTDTRTPQSHVLSRYTTDSHVTVGTPRDAGRSPGLACQGGCHVENMPPLSEVNSSHFCRTLKFILEMCSSERDELPLPCGSYEKWFCSESGISTSFWCLKHHIDVECEDVDAELVGTKNSSSQLNPSSKVAKSLHCTDVSFCRPTL